MTTLKHLIIKNINEQFKSMDKKEKTILSSLAFLKISNGEYYNKQYYSNSLAILKNKYGAVHTNYSNDPVTGKTFFKRSLYSLHDEYDYPNFEQVDKVQHYFIKPEIQETLNSFYKIVKESNNIEQYVDKIIEKQNIDKQFLSTLYSFDYLFENFENELFGKNVQYLFKEKSIENNISSDLFHNRFTLYSNHSDIKYNEKLDEQWINNKLNRDKIIKNGINKTKNINNMFDLYEKELNLISENIFLLKPHLKEKPNINNVEYFYFELTPGEYSYGEVELNLDINVNVLKKHGLKNPDFKNNKYEEVEKFFFNKENDLSNYFKENYYGLDYLNDESLRCTHNNRSYIVAKYNNETIGVFSFSSPQYDKSSCIKRINNICIKNNFRGFGIAEKFYDLTAKIIIDSDKILYNSMYSEQGRVKLPNLKERVKNKNPDFFMFETDIGISDNKVLKYICNFNKDFLIEISGIEKLEPQKFKKNIKKIKNIYDNSIEYIKNNQDKLINSDKYENQFDFLNARNVFLNDSMEKINGLFSEKKASKKYK